MDRVLARFADPGRRLLRHRRRPRAARGAAEGRPGQRGPVRQRDGDAGAAPARGVDRRGPLPRRRGARDADRDGRSWRAIRPASPSGCRRWTSRWRRSSRSRSSATRRTRPRRRCSPRRPARLPPEPGRRGQRGPGARPPIPLLADRIAIDGRPTAYVCRGFVCRLPVTTPEALRAELAAAADCRRPTARRPIRPRERAGRARPTLVTEPVEPRPAATSSCSGRAGRARRCCSAAGRRRWRSRPTSTSSRAAAWTRPTRTRAWSRGRSISPARRAAALGGDLTPTRAIAAYIAAIREAVRGGRRAARRHRRRLRRDRPCGARRAGRRRDRHFQALAAQLDLHLRTDLLVPLSRWVTPPSMPRRFDARFFAAALPAGASATLHGDEVVAQAWLRPGDALDAMAEGRLALWLPTAATLQQLEHVPSFEEVRERLAPGTLGSVDVEVGRPRHDPHRDAGRRAASPGQPSTPTSSVAGVRARRPGRPDRPGARPGGRAGRGARRRRSRRSP